MEKKLLHSVIQGQGPEVLILHGFLGMLDNWKSIGNQLEQNGFRVHLIDQRNHGNSFHSEVFNYQVLSDDLLNYANHHQLSDFILLGHSMGGKTAMQFALEHPERVQKLIVADIAPKVYPPHHGEILKALFTLPLIDLTSRGQADAHLAKFIPEAGVRQFLLKNLYRKADQSFGLKCNIKVLANAENEIGKNFEAVNKFTRPTLFMKGETSQYILAEDEWTIQHYFPGAQLIEIKKAGHWLHAENPGEFLTELLRFIKN